MSAGSSEDDRQEDKQVPDLKRDQCDDPTQQAPHLSKFSCCSQCAIPFEYWTSWTSWVRLGPKPCYLTIQEWHGMSRLFMDPQCVYEGTSGVWIHVCKDCMKSAASDLRGDLDREEHGGYLEGQPSRIMRDMLRDQLETKAQMLAIQFPENRSFDSTTFRAMGQEADKRRRCE